MGNAIKRATCFQLAVMKREITAEYDFPGHEIAFCVYFFFFLGWEVYFVSALSHLDQPEEITIHPQAAVEGDDVTLTCRAARYLYTDLQWLDSLNQTVTSGVSALQLGRYSISLSLQLYNVTKNSTAGYKCQPYKLHRRAALKSAALAVEGNEGLIATDWNSDSQNCTVSHLMCQD